MICIYRISQIEETLKEHFETRYKHDVNITGILLARPETRFTRSEILPNLNYWHYRSDYYTEFFCIGYTKDVPADKTAEKVVRIGNDDWYFSPQAFAEIVEHLEGKTSWCYDSGVYLLVTNSRYDRTSKSAHLDFSGAMVVDLQKSVKDKAIGDPSRFSDAIFHFAKQINESTKDPVWDFSDQQGLKILKKTLRQALIERLPKLLRNPAAQAIHFVARDLSVSRL